MPTLQLDTADTEPILNGVVVIFLFDFLPAHRSWAWLKLIQGTHSLYKTLPGLLFAKVMGSGEGGGFGLRPSATHQGLIFVFDGFKNARDCLKNPELSAYRDKSREWWQGMMLVNSCRGAWNSQGWQSSGFLGEDALRENERSPLIQDAQLNSKSLDAQQLQEPVASLTRGSIRASKAVAFWRYTPAAQEDLHRTAGCSLAVGLGEAPVLRQCTFSVWDSTKSMTDYAHQGAHLKAIAAAQKYKFFTESMFVRMQVLQMFGEWKGRIFNFTSKNFEQLQLQLQLQV